MPVIHIHLHTSQRAPANAPTPPSDPPAPSPCRNAERALSLLRDFHVIAAIPAERMSVSAKQALWRHNGDLIRAARHHCAPRLITHGPGDAA